MLAAAALKRLRPDFLTRDPGLEDLRMAKRLRVDFGRIAIDEDEIGPFTSVKATDPVLGKARIGRAAREAVYGAAKRDALLRPPATRWLPIQILPTDRRADTREGVGAFNRE